MAEIDEEELVDTYYVALYRFGLSLSRNEADAADLVQQTFYKWAAKGHQLRDASKVRTWLFTTIYRAFISKKRRDDRYVATESNPELIEPLQVQPKVIEALDGGIVQKALELVDIRYRAPVVLFYMQQHSYREIAEILDIPIGTVMSRISRGKADLRKLLLTAAEQEERKVISLKGREQYG